MPKPRTYYCQTCDAELWPTRDKRCWFCPHGHTKLLSKRECVNNHSLTRSAAATVEQRRAERLERQKHEDEVRSELPICGIEFRCTRRVFDVWWVMGRDEKFGFVGNGLRKGCVHAVDPTELLRGDGGKLRIVSLKPLSKRQLLFRADLIVNRSL